MPEMPKMPMPAPRSANAANSQRAVSSWLPRTVADPAAEFELQWQSRQVNGISEASAAAHLDFHASCAASLVSNCAMSEIITAVPATGLDLEHMKVIPDVHVAGLGTHDPLVSWAGSKGYRLLPSFAEMHITAAESDGQPTADEYELSVRIAEQTIPSQLLALLGHRIDSGITEFMLAQAPDVTVTNGAGAPGLSSIVRQAAHRKTGMHSPRQELPPNPNTAILCHPEVLGAWGVHQDGSRWVSDTGVKIVPNWHMPPPDGAKARIIVGDLTAAFMLPCPVTVKATRTPYGWRLQASTRTGCGIWGRREHQPLVSAVCTL